MSILDAMLTPADSGVGGESSLCTGTVQSKIPGLSSTSGTIWAGFLTLACVLEGGSEEDEGGGREGGREGGKTSNDAIRLHEVVYSTPHLLARRHFVFPVG